MARHMRIGPPASQLFLYAYQIAGKPPAALGLFMLSRIPLWHSAWASGDRLWVPKSCFPCFSCSQDQPSELRIHGWTTHFRLRMNHQTYACGVIPWKPGRSPISEFFGALYGSRNLGPSKSVTQNGMPPSEGHAALYCVASGDAQTLRAAVLPLSDIPMSPIPMRSAVEGSGTTSTASRCLLPGLLLNAS